MHDYEAVTVDSFVEGSFVAYGEAAYFELTVTESVIVNIYSTGDYDLEGYIFISKTAFAPFAYNIDGGADYNFLISNVSLEPGTYYINVYAEESSISYYELHVDTVE